MIHESVSQLDWITEQKFSTKENLEFFLSYEVRVWWCYTQFAVSVQVKQASCVKGFTPLVHCALHCVNWWQERPIYFVSFSENIHHIGESELTMLFIPPLKSDLQEDSVVAIFGNLQAPIGVAETSTQEGMAIPTLPLKIFPNSVFHLRS